MNDGYSASNRAILAGPDGSRRPAEADCQSGPVDGAGQNAPLGYLAGTDATV